MRGKAGQPEFFLVLGPIKSLENLHDELFHPKGGYWWQHWCAARETVCMFEKRDFERDRKRWTKCSQPFLEIPCRSYYPNPYP